ncbi:hypothetical protein TNCV_4436251 [Trichonephila clavipes]|nr:hypothetical protein TNCV_4436251 [Trichonephila clavipes]
MEFLSEETEQALTAIGVTSMTRSATSAAFSSVSGLIAARMDCTRTHVLNHLRVLRERERLQWMTVDDSLFLGTGLINSPQSHIMMSVMQDLTSLVFSVCGVTCRRFGCGDGIREEGLRDDYLS